MLTSGPAPWDPAVPKSLGRAICPCSRGGWDGQPSSLQSSGCENGQDKQNGVRTVTNLLPLQAVPFGQAGDVASDGQGLDSKLHPQPDKSHLQV